MPLHHDTVTASHPLTGAPIDLDKGIVILLCELWSRGIMTEYSCEGNHERPAYISFTSHTDITAFVALLAKYVRHEDMLLRIGIKHGKIEYKTRWSWGWTPDMRGRNIERYQVYMYPPDVPILTGILIADSVGIMVDIT